MSVLYTPYVDLDDLIEEHGEDKAQVLFEQFRNTPPDVEPDKEFAQSIVERLPKGIAVHWSIPNLKWIYCGVNTTTSIFQR
jgi:hypothetical protein